MDGSSTEDYGAGGLSSQTEHISAGQRCLSVDSLAEWRSSEQLENGMPSTSPPYWDTDDDDDDDDCGLRPSELFGSFTWKIENYSQINKRELRSNAFEVGGYKWYILIYPQGCDVCNHLSLFLCVANHDKLLPAGWSHFAQFTISVINKDPNISKFSDTLHRFWKKEHDWGWKKFMELSKVEDGFVDNETLVIKAQVQVIREKAHRLFRCLACEYRRELIRIYLSNVEQICRRFFEDRKNKLSKLIDDKVRWSSFCSFWLGIDQNSRRRISRDKLDTILRVVVKHFFVEKEVTSTLVMDSLHSGLKALECQSKNREERLRIEMEESAISMVRVDKDMFVLADDVIALLERVASEPLPAISLPPKDDRMFQNRTKEGSSADGFKDSIEREERRLTELGRRTIEIFVLSHIFSSRIEVAYQEAIALKRQEELIREEEAGQAEHDLRTKRATAEKDKRTKKKQGKQKRNNRKNKEKQRDLKPDSTLHNQKHVEKSLAEMAASGGELSLKHGNVMMNERMDTPEDVSDASYNGDDVAEPLYPDLGDRDRNPRNWDADELHPSVEASASEMSTYMPEKMNLGLDDSSSTCSTDSVPSVVSNGTHKENSMMIISNFETSPNRSKNSGNKHLQSHPAEIPDSSPSSLHEFDGDDASQKRLIQAHERIHLAEKQEPATTLQKKASKERGDAERPPNTRQLESSSSSTEPGRKTPPVLQQSKQSRQNYTAATTSIAPSTAPTSSSLIVPKRSTPLSAASPSSSTSRSEPQKLHTIPSEKNPTAPPASPFSRPSSNPLIPVAPKPNTPAISISLSASVTSPSAANPSPFAPSYVPQSYRNAIVGKSIAGSNPAGFAHSSQSSAWLSQSAVSSASPSSFPPPSTSRKEQSAAAASRPELTFGSVNPEASRAAHRQSVVTTNTEPCNSDHRVEPVSTPPLYQPHGYMVDEFPHLDIINDLLDEEQSTSNQYYHPLHHRHRSFSGRYSFPVDAASIDLMSSHASGRFGQAEQYYDDSFLSIYGRNSSARALERHHGGRFAQVDFPMAYANRQWPYNPADLSLVNLGGMDGGGAVYSYNNIADYTNLGRGMNQYGLYRP